jgi:tRNA nucleotidyltransferase (CCA-adding enzyme)
MLENVLSLAFPKMIIERVHGSRDYFQFCKKKLDYEIIPVLKIHASNYASAENVTDLSPEHVAWVEKYTDKNPLLNDEIRLMKQFMKTAKVYGAESYINGFSGHIVDILVIHYGSFLSLIKKFASLYNSKLDDALIIDHENNMKNPLKELNQSKISPLIIIDPIQKDRNAAAALNKEKLLDFVSSCKSFLDSPSKDFFIVKKFDLESEIMSRVKKLRDKKDVFKDKFKDKFSLIIISAYPHEGSRDIMGTKILKTYEDLKKQLLLNDFTICADFWHYYVDDNSGNICFIFKNEKLSTMIEQAGPPLNIHDDVDNFRRKHEKTYVKGNRIFSLVKRRYLLPEELLKRLFSEVFIKSRMKKILIKEKRIL